MGKAAFSSPFRYTLLSARDLLISFGPFAALAVALLVLAYLWLDPMPPQHVRLATGPAQSAYDEFGKRYRAALAAPDGAAWFRDQALAFCNINKAMPRELLEGSSLSTLVQMVSAGIGVTLIPEMAVPVETRSAAVSLARFAAPHNPTMWPFCCPVRG